LGRGADAADEGWDCKDGREEEILMNVAAENETDLRHLTRGPTDAVGFVTLREND